MSKIDYIKEDIKHLEQKIEKTCLTQRALIMKIQAIAKDSEKDLSIDIFSLKWCVDEYVRLDAQLEVYRELNYKKHNDGFVIQTKEAQNLTVQDKPNFNTCDINDVDVIKCCDTCKHFKTYVQYGQACSYCANTTMDYKSYCIHSDFRYWEMA